MFKKNTLSKFMIFLIIFTMNFINSSSIYAKECTDISLSYTSYSDPSDPTKCCFEVTYTSTSNEIATITMRPKTHGVTFYNGVAEQGYDFQNNNNYPHVIQWYQPGTQVIQQGTHKFGGFCLNGQTGTAVIIVAYSNAAGFNVCIDSLVVDMCGSSKGCIEIKDVDIACVKLWKFKKPKPQEIVPSYSIQAEISNLTGADIEINVEAPGDSVSPSKIAIPVNGSQIVNLTLISDRDYGDNVCIYFKLPTTTADDCNQSVNECIDSICIEIPFCAIDNCQQFTKIINAKVTELNGTINISGDVTAGPLKMQYFKIDPKAKAKIKKSCEQTPTWTNFNNYPTLLNGLMPGIGEPNPNHLYASFLWQTNILIGKYIVMKNNEFSVNYTYPPATPGCDDSLEICVNYKFGDAVYNFCDTTICYTVFRKAVPTPWSNVNNIGASGSVMKGKKEQIQMDINRDGGSTYLYQNSSNTLLLGFSVPKSTIEGENAINYSAKSGTKIEKYRQNFQLGTMKNTKTGEIYQFQDGTVKFPLNFSEADGENVYTEFEISFNKEDAENVKSLELDITMNYDYLGIENMSYMYPVSTNLNYDITHDNMSENSEAGTYNNLELYKVKMTNTNSLTIPIGGIKISTNDGNIISVGAPSDANEFFITPGPKNPVNNKHGLNVSNFLLSSNPLHQNANIEFNVDFGDDVEFDILIENETGKKCKLDYITYDNKGNLISNGNLMLENSILSVIQENPDKEAIKLESYPNPTDNNLTVNFRLDKFYSNVTINITDINGKMLGTVIDNKEFVSGNHAIYYNAGHLSNGTYYLSLKTGDKINTIPFKILK